ncbi:MAG: hypothetical protein VX777_07325 [Chlamydiota bacterium]|nr:hypothetical protein [Chlamydiota bacterium]
MRKLLTYSLLQITLFNHQMFGECALCEEIKERNRNLPPPKHVYYEDYLEELKAEGKSIPGDIDFSNSNDTDPDTNIKGS